MGKTTRDFSFPESVTITAEHKMDRPSFSSNLMFRRSQSNIAANLSKNKFVSRKAKKFVPRKAAVELTDRARTLFQKLLENHPSTVEGRDIVESQPILDGGTTNGLFL